MTTAPLTRDWRPQSQSCRDIDRIVRHSQVSARPPARTGEAAMNDGSRTPKRPASMEGSVNRRAFLERGARLGLAVGGASAIGRGLWLPDLDSLGDASLLQARSQQRAQTLALANAAIAMRWSVDAGRLHVVSVEEPNGLPLALPDDAFTLLLSDGEPIRASEMRVVATPRVEPAPVRNGASRLAER